MKIIHYLFFKYYNYKIKYNNKSNKLKFIIIENKVK